MTTRTTQGTPTDREGGIGNVNPALVRERAAELAVADGRPDTDVTPQDLDRAEKELRAELGSEGGTRKLTETSNSLQPDDAVGSAGRESVSGESEARQTDAESLIQEGIDEAVHDERVESGKETLSEGTEAEEPEEKPPPGG